MHYSKYIIEMRAREKYDCIDVEIW
jgi:hypothetical protein